MSDSSSLILVVEDDPDIAEVIQILLTNEKYIVRHARHGAAALKLLRDGVIPRLILLDLMMPVMDGWQFRAQQLRDPTLAGIPVVIMTGAGDAARGDTLPGCEHLMRKPVDLSHLLAIVARLCPPLRPR